MITNPDPFAANTPKKKTETELLIILVKHILAKTRTISSPKLAQMALLLTRPEIHAPSIIQTQELTVEGSMILLDVLSQQPLNVVLAEEGQHLALPKAVTTTTK